MADLSLPSRNPELLRRAGVTLALLAVVYAGSWVPLPGVDVEPLIGPTPVHNTAVQRLSLMSLGITPLLSALILAEVAMIAAPPFRRWVGVGNNRDVLAEWTTVVALLLAAYQANGIAVALEGIRGLVDAPGLIFRIGIVVSLVGATALLIWLASLVSRHGIGNGFWILVALPHVASFVQALIAQGTHWGPAGLLSVATSIAFLALAAAVLAALTLTTPPLADPEEVPWAIILGFGAASVLLFAPVLLLWLAGADVSGFDLEAMLASRSAILLPVLTVPLVILLRRRSFGSAPWAAPAMPLALAVACLVAAATAFAYLPDPPLFPPPAVPLMLAAVGLAVASSLRAGKASGTT
ncbi:MAG: hypothetical protein AB7S70_04655 [Hyphomicrobium sp.]|uniref:hypothetical protein n=1 Tax=Hyphomicrobium sp. TaxID=82 RepID=UPI003D0F4361